MGIFSKPAAPAPTPARDAINVRNGSRWFFIIGGLSVLNSMVALAGSSMMMLFGLTSTLFATYVAIGIGGTITIVAMVFTVAIGLAFVGLGWFADRGAQWALITGGAIYAADGVLTFILQDYFAGFAHLFALFIIYTALMSARRLQAGGSLTPVGQAPAPGVVPVTAPSMPPMAGAPGHPAGMALTDGPQGFVEAKAPQPLS